MSYHQAETPPCETLSGAIELLIEPRARDLGGFSVRRVLPASERRMVGPFVFFDHMGPAEFPPGEGIQVRPHPHIGLATITYLFEGEMVHRDSLGYVQTIKPGEINLMTAGRGIVHSERAGDDLDMVSRSHGIQSWIALPRDKEECEPAFQHFGSEQIPQTSVNDVSVRVIFGEAFGCHSPVKSFSPTLYLECHLPSGTTLPLPENYMELAFYVIEGEITVDHQVCAPGKMAVVRLGRKVSITAGQASHVVVIGGEALGKRQVWWNFVSSSRERIEKAKQDWKHGKFPKIPGETEFIPLPD